METHTVKTREETACRSCPEFSAPQSSVSCISGVQQVRMPKLANHPVHSALEANYLTQDGASFHLISENGQSPPF